MSDYEKLINTLLNNYSALYYLIDAAAETSIDGVLRKITENLKNIVGAQKFLFFLKQDGKIKCVNDEFEFSPAVSPYNMLLEGEHYNFSIDGNCNIDSRLSVYFKDGGFYGFPIVFKTKKVYGFVLLQPSSGEADEYDFLKLFFNQVSFVFENFELSREVEKEKEVLFNIVNDYACYYNLAIALQQDQDTEKIARVIYDGLKDGMGLSSVLVNINHKGFVAKQGEIKDEENILKKLKNQKESEKFLNNNSAIVYIPIVNKEKYYGYILVSDSLEILNSEKTDSLALYSSQCSVAVENMLLSAMVKSENEKVKEELKMASAIQQNILSRSKDIDSKILKTSAVNIPFAHIGGDLFFSFEQDEFYILGVADVTGHGAPAALIMSLTYGFFETHAHTSASPVELLEKVNKSLIDTIGDSGAEFVTAAVLYINKHTKKVSYSTASHPPLLVLKNGEAAEYSTDGFFLSVFDDGGYKNNFFIAEKNDIILIYTDGLIEAQKGKELFGVDKLKVLLSETSPRSADEIKNDIISGVMSFAEKNMDDDLTVMVIKFK